MNDRKSLEYQSIECLRPTFVKEKKDGWFFFFSFFPVIFIAERLSLVGNKL